MKKFPLFLSALLVLAAILPAHAQQDSKEAESLFVAQKAFDDGFYDVAYSLLDRFLKTYPSSEKAADVGLLIGRCYFQQNRYLDALKQFEDLLSAPGAQKIKDSLLFWIAEVHFRGNNFSRAAGYYKMLTTDYPASPYAASAFYSLGWCLTQEQQYAQALSVFKTLEEKFPGQQQAQEAAFKIIECLYNLKQYPELKERVNSYITRAGLDKQKLNYLVFYLAEADYYLNDFSQALENYTKVSATDEPKLRALARLGQGWSMIKLKRFPEADAVLSGVESASLEPQSQDILYLGRAVLCFETGRFAESQEFYGKLMNSSDPVLSFQGWLGSADCLYNRGDYQAAVKTYRQLSEKAGSGQLPTELVDKLHYGLAWAFLKEGEFKDAITEFQKIAQHSEDKIFQVSALCQIGDAYQDAGEMARARETYEKILKDFPGNFYSDYVQYQLGVTLLKTGDYDAAMVNFLGFKKSYPDSKLVDDAEYSLGLSYFQKKDYAASKDIFINFGINYRDSKIAPQAAYLLGTCHYNLGEFQQAIEVFKTLIRNYSQDTEMVQKAEYEIADCYYQLGDEKEAMDRFNQLRVKYPDSSLTAEIMWWLGEYYYRKNDLSMAIRYFSSLIHDFKDSSLVADAYYALGSVYVEEAKYEDAIAQFRKVGEVSASELSGQAQIAIADVYARQDDHERALKEYELALQKYPQLTHLIFPKIGDLQAAAGRYDQALEMYDKSLDAVPVREKPEIILKIAEIYQATGRVKEAIGQYLKIPYLFGENGEIGVKAFLRVAKLDEEQGATEEALKIYRKVEEMNCPESKYAKERIQAIEAGRAAQKSEAR